MSWIMYQISRVRKFDLLTERMEGVLQNCMLRVAYPLFAALKQWLDKIFTQRFPELVVIPAGRGKTSSEETLHTLRNGCVI